jgi:hypothetical protein
MLRIRGKNSFTFLVLPGSPMFSFFPDSIVSPVFCGSGSEFFPLRVLSLGMGASEMDIILRSFSSSFVKFQSVFCLCRLREKYEVMGPVVA